MPQPCPLAIDPPTPRYDRHTLLVLLLSLVILIVRNLSVSAAHSENMDTEYHLRRGYSSLTRNKYDVDLHRIDGPLGQMLLTLPMIASGCDPGDPIQSRSWPATFSVPGQGARTDAAARLLRGRRRDILYGYSVTPEQILARTGVWYAILFAPVVALAFTWSRALYGLRAAYLAAGLILLDPNVAAHTSTIALDALGAGFILVALYTYWRHAQRPTRATFVASAFATAAALLTKHTAILLPAVFLAIVLLTRPHRRISWRRASKCHPERGLYSAGVEGSGFSAELSDTAVRQSRTTTGTAPPSTFLHLVLWSALTFLFLWALTGFDVSRPTDAAGGFLSGRSNSHLTDAFYTLMEHPRPAGVYFGSLVATYFRQQMGNPNYLWGHVSSDGWWYYFPVLLTYKLPIGFAAVILLAAVSYFRHRFRREELFLLLPAAALAAMIMASKMNIGIRHFLPVYLPLLVFASRALVPPTKAFVTAAVLVCAVAGAAHALGQHPDYVSYLNRPIDKPHLLINDTNIDWGQNLKQVRAWADARHKTDPRTIHVLPRWNETGAAAPYYLGTAVHILARTDPAPTSGLLVLSPFHECGLADDLDRYAFLRPVKPLATIGHSINVYDLDALKPSP